MCGAYCGEWAYEPAEPLAEKLHVTWETRLAGVPHMVRSARTAKSRSGPVCVRNSSSRGECLDRARGSR